MNKYLNARLNELAEQAHTYAKYEYRYPEDLSEDYGMIYETKFAESIVKECCTVLAKCKEEPFPFDEDYACRLLKTHFGVE